MNRLRDRFNRMKMRLRRTFEVYEIRASIGWIGAPLDEPRCFELVDHTCERNRLHLQRLGEVDLPHAIAARQMHERARLRERQGCVLTLPKRATHQARDVGDKKAEVLGLCGQWRVIRKFCLV